VACFPYFNGTGCFVGLYACIRKSIYGYKRIGSVKIWKTRHKIGYRWIYGYFYSVRLPVPRTSRVIYEIAPMALDHVPCRGPEYFDDFLLTVECVSMHVRVQLPTSAT